MFGPYYLFLCGGVEHVGIVYLNGQQQERLQGQPIILHSDRVEWFSDREIGSGGPIELRVEPYQYTRVHEGVAYATDVPLLGHHWFLRPANCGDLTFVIGTDPSCRTVWTAQGSGKPIAIKEFDPSEGRNQVFKFVPLE